jgi:hypothetical protein
MADPVVNRTAKRGMRLLSVMALVALMAMLFSPLVARADDVSNNVDASIDAAVEATTLVIGGTSAVTYTVTPRNGDNQNGCNIQGNELLVVSVSSSSAAVSVSPATLFFGACGIGPSVTISAISLGTSTITLSVASNNTGGTFNLAPATFSVSVIPPPNTTPVMDPLSDLTAEATSAAGAVVNFTATATDAESGSIAAVCVPASGSTFPLGVTTVDCTATDPGGLSATGSFTVSVVDTTAPVVTVPADITAEATSSAGALVNFSASASDIVDGSLTPTCVPASGSTFALGTTAVICSASDAHGNAGSGSFDMTVVDTTAPVLTLPANITAEATGPSGADVSYAASATDAVDGAITPKCAPASGSTFALGETTINCSATDSESNTSSGSFTVTVVDTTAPVVTVPDDIEVEATGPDGADVTFDEATAFDLVDGALVASCSPVSGSTFPLGVTVVTCSATDAHLNTGTDTFTITVEDTTGPVLALPANITEEATGPDGAVVTFTATASDLVDGSVPVTCAPASGSTFVLGTTPVNCSAADAAGNEGTGSFNVTVEDTTSPAMPDLDDVTKEATGPTGATVNYTVDDATDIVDGDISLSCNPPSGSLFALGDTDVDCTAEDAAGNTGHASFVVHIVDTTDPELTLPADFTVEATGPSGAVVSFDSDVSATDIVDQIVTIVCDPVSGSTFPLGPTTVDCTATDDSGNEATGSFTITVVDTTDPVLTVPADITAEATGPLGALVTYPAATATDLVDPSVDVVCIPATPVQVAVDATETIICTATDDFGNESTDSFTITVEDTTGPTVIAPADITVEATGPSGAVVTYSGESATDLVDGSVAVTCIPASGSTFALSTHPVTCTATDTRGNPGSDTFTITVEDTTAPAVTVPANVSVFGTSPSGAVVNFTATAVDIVDGPLTPTCAPPSGSIFGYGLTTVTCTATDGAGNTGSDNFLVEVKHLTLKGFYQPVDMGNVYNTVKGGSTVPLKFEIFAGPTEITSTTGIEFKVVPINCVTSVPGDEIEMTSTGGTSLRYDSTAGQFIQNWKTPTGAAKCYMVTMYAADGSSLSALFKTK